MKHLLLMRHGEAGWGDGSQDDFDRSLTDAGRRASKAIGAWISKHDLVPDTVLVSAAARTTQTWEILRDALPDMATAQPTPDLYLASPGTLLAHIERVEPDTEITLVIAHNPGLEALARLMAGPGSGKRASNDLLLGFPSAGLAVFELNGDDWRTMSAEGGQLRKFIRPDNAE